MASHSLTSSSSSSSWTPKQNKCFERALAIFDKDTPERWENVASMVAGKSVEDVRRHYDVLVEDLNCIESGQVPFPNYKPISSKTVSESRKVNGNPTTLNTDDDHRRMMYLKLQ